MKRHLTGLLAGVLAFYLGLGFFLASPHRRWRFYRFGPYWGAHFRGKIQAHRDIWQGRYVFYASGYGNGGSPAYIATWREKYGVTYISSGCVVDSIEERFVRRSYNSVSEPAIIEKYGADVWERVRVAAQEEEARQAEFFVPE